MGVTDPGATAPTDNYDITIVDEYGSDIFGATLTNRDTTNTEEATPLIGGTSYGSRLVTGDLTFTLTNNSVNEAVGTCILYFVLDK